VEFQTTTFIYHYTVTISMDYKESYLDLSKVTLYGWEKTNSDLVIDAIVRGIELEDDFPAVWVKPWKDGFRITGMAGGHSRAAGHYIAGKHLKVVISEDGRSPSFLGIMARDVGTEKESPSINIKDIVLADDTGQYNYRKSIVFYR